MKQLSTSPPSSPSKPTVLQVVITPQRTGSAANEEEEEAAKKNESQPLQEIEQPAAQDTRPPIDYEYLKRKHMNSLEFAANYRYNDVVPLGSGSYGTVFKGYDLYDDRVQIALKISKPDETLRDESEILRKLDHPRILKFVNFYQRGRMNPHDYLVTEYLQGGELLDRIARKSSYTENEARSILHKLMEAVCYLHSVNIVHRFLFF